MDKGKLKKDIVRDTAKFTGAQYCSQGIGFVTSIAMRRFLGPYYTGIWSLFRIILEYCGYNSLGVDRAAMYKIPFFIGKKDTAESGRIENAAFGFIFFMSIVASIAIIVVTTIMRHRFTPPVVVGLYALSLIVILEKISAFFILLLKARDNFSVLSKAIIFDAVLNVLLVFLLVKNFSIYGLYAMVVLSAIANTLFVYTLTKYKIKPVIDLGRVRELVKYGFPILGLSLLGVMLRSVDRLVIAKMIGITFVGYYSLGIIARNYIEVLASFSTVMRPKMLREYGREEKAEHMKGFVLVSCETVAYTLPILLSMIFFAGPVLVRFVLPKFIPGILVMQILLVDSFFHSSYLQSFQFLIAIGKQKRILPIIAAAIVLNFALDCLVIKAGYGIYGVAAVTALMSFVSFVVIQSYAMKHFESYRTIALFILKIFIPLVYVGGVTLLVDRIVQLANPFLGALLKMTLVCAASAPLLFYINRKTDVISILFSMLISKVKKKDKRSEGS